MEVACVVAPGNLVLLFLLLFDYPDNLHDDDLDNIHNDDPDILCVILFGVDINIVFFLVIERTSSTASSSSTTSTTTLSDSAVDRPVRLLPHQVCQSYAVRH